MPLPRVKRCGFAQHYRRVYLMAPRHPESFWSLIESKDYLSIPVQTTRGCPNRCDFCDVIQYLGRKPRGKPVRHFRDFVTRPRTQPSR